jgi:predicted PurR-regulated permease PerM
MILYSVSLSLIGFEEAIFVGLLTGFLAFIPYLGALIGLLLALILGFLHFTGWLHIILILIIFAIINFVEGNFLTPKLIGKKVGLHPIWIIFSLLAFGTWFGFLGVIIALPFAASMSVVLRLLIERYKHTHFYLDLPHQPKEK